MRMPTPSPGHRQLTRLVGTWEGEETMHPSPWDREGGVARGRHHNRLALGGFAVLSDYEQEREGATTFTGHGVYTYRPESDEVTLHWFDSLGSPAEVFHGAFEGDVLTLAHGGPGMHVRMTRDFSADDRLKTTMEMSRDGASWDVLFEGTYRRS